MFLLFVLLIAVAQANWVIKFKDGVDAQEFAHRHDLEYIGPFTVLPDYFIFKARKSKLARRILESPHVEWAEEQRMRPRVFPRTGIDPLYDRQWHLHTSPIALDTDRIPLNLTGKGITIAIVDDGLQHIHPDISPNYAELHSWNFNADRADPAPTDISDSHGTAAAGVAAAARFNNYCGRGVAPEPRNLIFQQPRQETHARLLGIHDGSGTIVSDVVKICIAICPFGAPRCISDSLNPPGSCTGQSTRGSLTDVSVGCRGIVIYELCQGNVKDALAWRVRQPITKTRHF
jgi:hypothetical protein